MITEFGIIKKVIMHRENKDDIYCVIITRLAPHLHRNTEEAKCINLDQSNSFILKLNELGSLAKGLIVSYSYYVNTKVEKHLKVSSHIIVQNITPVGDMNLENRLLQLNKEIVTNSTTNIINNILDKLDDPNYVIGNKSDWSFIKQELSKFEVNDKNVLIGSLIILMVDELLQDLITQ